MRQSDRQNGQDAAPGSARGGDPETARIVQKKEFVDRVIAASGATKAAARPLIDAVLDQLGLALAAGETLAIPPFGKARVSRHKDVRGSEIITLRLRRKPGAADEAEG